MRRQQLLNATRRERVNDNNALIVPVAQGHQAFNNGVGQRVTLNDQGAVVAVLYVLRLVEPLLKSLRKPAERWSQGWARALKQCGEIEPDHVGAAIMVRCPALLMTDGQNVQLIVVQSGKLGKGVTFAHQALDQQ